MISYGNIAEHKIADDMEAQLKKNGEDAALTQLQRQLLMGPHAAGARPAHAKFLDGHAHSKL